MPALIPTNYSGTVVWLGRVLDRADSLRATAVDEFYASFTGVEGEDHSGLTRASCSRVTSQYVLDTEIRNTRQFSIVSAEELAKIAEKTGLERIEPDWLGVSIVISGIPDFTFVPPSSRLQMPSGATLTVDMENRPCQLPAKVIEEDAPGYGKAFKPAAANLRGVTAWVECEGAIKVGDRVTLHVPDQRVWEPSLNGTV